MKSVGITFRHRSAVAFGIVMWVIARSPAAAGELQAYDDTPGYTIHTDLGHDVAREAAIRATLMAPMYQAHTRLPAVAPRERSPLYLYREPDDYHTAGGPPGTAGALVYSGRSPRLMIVAGAVPTHQTWRLVQHEGFHQFARAATGRKLPIWLDEGLADYFGEAIFTGDGYLTGVIPAWRLRRLKEAMANRDIESLSDFSKLTGEQWNQNPTVARYDQAWSIVHFLLHDQRDGHEQKLSAFIRALAGGRDVEPAWLDAFGPVEEVEARWRTFWQSEAPRPSDERYARAVACTLTSFLARATAQGQRFATFDSFRAAALAKDVRTSATDWLPPALLNDAIETADKMGRCELAQDAENPVMRLIVDDGATWIGSFVLRNGRVEKISVSAVARR